MASLVFCLRRSTLWIVTLVPFFLCASFPGLNPLSTLTFLVMIASMFLFTSSKRKTVQNEAFSSKMTVSSPELEETSRLQSKCSPQMEEVLSDLKSPSEPISEDKEIQENENVQTQSIQVRSQDLYSESESMDHSSTSEDSDVDWSYFGYNGQSPECSDDSISDEESLIEIALPTGQYVSSTEEPKSSLQKKLPVSGYSPETIFSQNCLMELLAEINEEENLIEIDISMGSIKCPRFEIEA